MDIKVVSRTIDQYLFYQYFLGASTSQFMPDYLELSDAQIGLRKPTSSEMVLLSQQGLIANGLKHKLYFSGVHIVSLKPFHFMNHSIWPMKLNTYGIRAVADYCLGRWGCSISSVRQMKSGVTQGGVLTPEPLNLYSGDVFHIKKLNVCHVCWGY